jgi:hypothetical protein
MANFWDKSELHNSRNVPASGRLVRRFNTMEIDSLPALSLPAR